MRNTLESSEFNLQNGSFDYQLRLFLRAEEVLCRKAVERWWHVVAVKNSLGKCSGMTHVKDGRCSHQFSSHLLACDIDQ